MSQTINVLIIGAGNIAAFYDNPEDESVLTHAHAFSLDSNYKLVGFVDADYNKAQAAARKWGCKAFRTMGDIANEKRIDLVCIAVPDEMHFEVARVALEFPIKMLFIEKPLAVLIEEAHQIMSMAEQKDVRVFVNYSRRFVPEFTEIREKISRGMYGDFLGGSGIYGKGLLHNGSHLIDLLRFFVGEIRSFIPLSIIRDYRKEDPTVSAILKLDNQKSFMLHTIDSRIYEIFEMDLFFERKRIRIIDSGLTIQEFDLTHSEEYPAYKNLRLTLQYNTQINIALKNAADQIASAFKNGTSLNSCGLNALTTLKSCLSLRERVAHLE